MSTLPDLLRTAASEHGERPAVVDRERICTYQELDERSSRLASVLSGLGVRSGDRVGIYLEKSVEAVVAVWGILKVAAYVPFDPAAPPARLGVIAADAGLKQLVTGVDKSDAWGELCSAAPIEQLVVLDGGEDVEPPTGTTVVRVEDFSAGNDTSAQHAPRDSDLAYILYTSGSTGVPKGVMLSHENARAFVDWATDEFEVSQSDRLSSHAPLHFDLSVFDLFAACRAGAAVVLVPRELSLFPVQLVRWIHDQAITVWYSVPSILTMLTLRGRIENTGLPHLRAILFAGEVFPTKYLRELMERLPHVRFANLFGPTETNVNTWFDVPRWDGEPPASIPIGKPVPGVEIFAVRPDGSIAERGEVGEMYVRGPTVMRGYWGDPDRTAATLLHGWGPPGSRFGTYRTGDLARLDEDGNWIFLGRRDAQVKSRGYRIELGDVESALHRHPAVLECAVIAVPDDIVTNRLKAFVVAREHVEEQELIAFVSNHLPRYMAPEMIEFRDALPRSSTGKVDRRALSDDRPEAPRVQ